MGLESHFFIYFILYMNVWGLSSIVMFPLMKPASGIISPEPYLQSVLRIKHISYRSIPDSFTVIPKAQQQAARRRLSAAMTTTEPVRVSLLHALYTPGRCLSCILKVHTVWMEIEKVTVYLWVYPCVSQIYRLFCILYCKAEHRNYLYHKRCQVVKSCHAVDSSVIIMLNLDNVLI